MAQVRDLLEPVQPFLIYLRSTDLEAALARKLEFLQQERQLDDFMTSMNSQPYLRHRGLSGHAGVLELWQSVQWALEYFYQQEWKNSLLLERDIQDEDSVQISVAEYVAQLA